MKSFIASLALVAGAVAIEQNDLEFMNFIATHGRNFATLEEFNFRQALWSNMEEFINEHNASGANFTVGHNKFSDWTEAEFNGLMGYRPSSEVRLESDDFVDAKVNLPASVNWIDAGAVNQIQDQGQCGSCWAFAADAAMEGIDQITNGTLQKFAEQQLVSCVTLCFGCNGGNVMTVYSHYATKNFMDYESAWTYTATNGSCSDAPSSHSSFKTTSGTAVTVGSQTALKTAISVQPVAIAIQANKRVFQSYQSGVFDSTTCGTSLDHAVTLVGYGNESGQDYYLMRNSWGVSWGEQGYMKMAMTGDGDGICGCQMDPVTPQV